MGVPVITCAGPDHRSRVTASQLQSIGLSELIAHNLAEYAGIAVNLASDRELLVKHRLGLRDLMENSPLMDASRFTTALESAYREAFARWCEQSAVR
jgi:predicted O-linked N-acetylglucosamine transferase (SPINDLY family)